MRSEGGNGVCFMVMDRWMDDDACGCWGIQGNGRLRGGHHFMSCIVGCASGDAIKLGLAMIEICVTPTTPPYTHANSGTIYINQEII